MEFQGGETLWGSKSCRIRIEVPKLRRNEPKCKVSPKKKKEASPKHILNGKEKGMKLESDFEICWGG